MFINRCPLILASASPRRQELLDRLGLTFQVAPASIEEIPDTGETPANFARRMALAKASQVAAIHPEACTLGADTVVALDQQIFGKPADEGEALSILQNLRGKTHAVITGFALVAPWRHLTESDTCSTLVTFAHYDDAVLLAYVRSGEPMDKAGAYGIQGKGTFLARTITGSCSNVIGLPVQAVLHRLLHHRLIEPV